MSITFVFLKNKVGTSFVDTLFKWNEKYRNIKFYNWTDINNNLLSVLISSWRDKSTENDYLVIYRDGHIEESDLPFRNTHVDIVISLSNDPQFEFYYIVLSKFAAELPEFKTIDEFLVNARAHGLSVIEKDHIVFDQLTVVQGKKI